MKAKSKSIAALLGVAVILNVSALAGPGPQPQLQPRKVSSEPKTVLVTTSPVRKSPTAAKAVIKRESSLLYVSGPQSATYAFRR